MKQTVYEQVFSLLSQTFLGNLLALYKFKYFLGLLAYIFQWAIVVLNFPSVQKK